ncbi:hypothetical protein [Halorubrum aethiopicum]|uniref:hypothetical protein n=1 Tax=Halorubrum aethiopicum TaxID=1758255 RepID=UPI000835A33A|nr:hypothetical protein [Halorubrum aethiopicum]
MGGNDADGTGAGGSDADGSGTEGNNANGGDREPGPVAPEEIGPAGAMIAVAFTGSVIAFAGFGLLVLLGEVGLVLVAVGLLAVLASPAAYFRYRQLYR